MERELKTFIRNVRGHNCEHQPEEHILVEYINEGILVEFRRKLKSLFMVDASHLRAKEVFKSTYRMRMEEERHLNKHYYMIHPYSKFRVWWETFMILVYYSLLIFSPLLLNHEKSDFPLVIWKLLMDLICSVDIIFCFITGYLDVNSQKVILNLRQIGCRYICSFFLFDFVSSLPIHFILQMTKTFYTPLRFFKASFLFRLARLPTAARYLRDFLERRHFYSYYLKIFTLVINFIIVIIWSTLLFFLYTYFFVPADHKNLSPEERLMSMLISCNIILRRYLFITTIYKPNFEITSVLIVFFCFLIGAVMNYTIFAIIVQICSKHNSATNKYKDMMLQANEYAKYKDMSPALKQKLFQFIDFKFQKKVYNENFLLSTMSTSMKQEVLLSGTKNLLEKVEFFKDLPSNIIVRIVEKLKSVIYLPNDVIVQAGIAGNAMFFIYVGTVAIYTKAGKEICHLHEGSHFGEIALIINEPRIASVHAVEECELFRLSRRDFQKAIEPFPEVIDKIKSSALGRLKNTLRVMDDEEIENAGHDNAEDDNNTDKRHL